MSTHWAPTLWWWGWGGGTCITCSVIPHKSSQAQDEDNTFPTPQMKDWRTRQAWPFTQGYTASQSWDWGLNSLPGSKAQALSTTDNSHPKWVKKPHEQSRQEEKRKNRETGGVRPGREALLDLACKKLSSGRGHCGSLWWWRWGDTTSDSYLYLAERGK